MEHLDRASDEDKMKEMITHTGARILVKWSMEEIGDSGWQLGWYAAEIQAYDSDSDTATVMYVAEPGSVYSIQVTPYITLGKIE